MPKVKICYLNDNIQKYEPNQVEITDGHLIMDWKNKRVLINTLNLAWIEVDNT